MSTAITEAQTLTVTESPTPGRVRLQLIDSGWGSSGYYSAPVLENAATEQVWPKGTHVFFDHPSESERHDRPERSVRDLAMILDEDATYDPDTRALVAEAKVIGPYRELVTDPVFMEAVGMSIRASADTTVGEAEGRKGTLVTQLIEGVSVDLVTRAGRGGRILAAVESARRDLTEATAHDVEAALDAAVAEHTRDGFVRDYDPDAGIVYVRSYDPTGDVSRVHAHPYTYDAPNAVIDWDDATEVRRTTNYVPITPATGDGSTSAPAPAGQSTATESQETTMATTQIEESQLTALRQDAERVPTLESERDTATRERDEAREALNARDRTDAARAVIETQAREAGITFTALEERGLLADLPVTESGDLNKAAYTTSVTEAATVKAEQAGAGSVTGFGTTVTENGGDSYSEAEFDKTFNYTAQEA